LYPYQESKFISDCVGHFSKLWNLGLYHRHHWFHVRLKHARDNSLIQAAVLCGFELLLVDIAVFVTDSRWDVRNTLWETLNKGEHLGSQDLQDFLVAISKQTR